MGIRLLVAATILAPFPASAFQVTESHKTALERRGLHHSSIQGQFVSPEGKPVSGIRVQINAGHLRALPLDSVVTGADGRFIFRDVNSPYLPDLRWYPPEQWQKGVAPISGESGENIEMGAIHLQPDTVVRVMTELVGGSPLAPEDRPPTIVLQGNAEFGPRIVAEQIGTELVLR